MRAAVTIAALVLCTGVLAGCTAAASPPESEGSGSNGSFTGPWADLFESTYAEATSDDERDALSDGVVSAEEYAYFQDQIIQCLETLGVEGHFNPDGSLDYTKPKSVSPDDVRDCNAENGIRVIALHDAIVRNPTHRDETEIMLECLQRTDVVGEGYTRADLENGVDLEQLSASPDFAGCAADPLGYEVD